MKHDSHMTHSRDLPDAPMAMPKQKLERPAIRLSSWRQVFAVFSWF